MTIETYLLKLPKKTLLFARLKHLTGYCKSAGYHISGFKKENKYKTVFTAFKNER